MCYKNGTGIKRIRESCKNNNKVEFRPGENYFFVEIVKGLTEGLTEGLKSLINLISNRQGIKAKECSEALNRPLKTIERQIKTLVDRRIVERRGSKKTGGYYIKNTSYRNF